MRTFLIILSLILKGFLFGCSNKDSSTKLDESVKIEPEAVGFSCPHNERREIFFTSHDEKDILDIDIIGNDCDTSKIIIKIIASAEKIVHRTEDRAFNYIYDDSGNEAIQRMLETLILSESVLQSLAKHDCVLTEENGYYKVNPPAVARVKHGQTPLFCHKAGKSYSHCYIYWDGVSVFTFSTGS